jgi:glucan phosphoethanolaminetransferase (alkaline phosphatase superfamily)
MKRYLPYLVATAFIICMWFILGWLTYPRIKNQLTKRNIYLLLLLLGLVIGALAFTYFQTGGTFIW